MLKQVSFLLRSFHVGRGIEFLEKDIVAFLIASVSKLNTTTCSKCLLPHLNMQA